MRFLVSLMIRAARPVASVCFCVWFGLAPLVVRGAEGRWVTTWTTAPQSTSADNLPPAPLAHNTLRQFVPVSIGGSLVRFRFSNAYGSSPVTIQVAALARATGQLGSGEIDAGTSRALRFRGAPGAVIPPGGVLYSDPLLFDLTPLASVAVSVHFGAVSSTVITGHGGSRTTSFIQNGDVVAAPTMNGATRTDRWYVITGLEVLAPAVGSGTVLALGDSITDGRGSTTNGNDRWTDFLAGRLAGNAATVGVAVGNLGIGGTGVALAQDRFRRDILDQSGARWVVVSIGVNDIGGSSAAPATIVNNLVSAYTSMAAQARARGLKVYGATLTPFGGSGYYSADHETARQSINQWIRTTAVMSGVYDACIDFDATVRDPANPVNLSPAYNSDNLHITPAGYSAMAEAIDLTLFAP